MEDFEISVNQGIHGQWILSAMYNGFLIVRQFYEYEKEEAIEIFQEELKKGDVYYV